MVCAQLVAAMRDVEAGVLLAVAPQDLGDAAQRHAARTGSAATPVEEAIVAVLLVTVFAAAHRAAGHTENLGGLPPLQLSCDCFENHGLNFHGPLHG